MNININEPVFFPYSIKTSKCNGSCNNIDDPYPKMCILYAVKIINLKVINLISRANGTYIKLCKTCKCKCRIDASGCNNEHSWNEDKYRCECEELINKGSCGKGFISNPSNCECECDKSCDVGEHLD